MSAPPQKNKIETMEEMKNRQAEREDRLNREWVLEKMRKIEVDRQAKKTPK